MLLHLIIKKSASWFAHKYEAPQQFSIDNVSWAANPHIVIISEVSYDTEDWSNDAENSAVTSGIKYIQIEKLFLSSITNILGEDKKLSQKNCLLVYIKWSIIFIFVLLQLSLLLLIIIIALLFVYHFFLYHSWWPYKKRSFYWRRMMIWSGRCLNTGAGSGNCVKTDPSSQPSTRKSEMVPVPITPMWPSGAGPRRCRRERWAVLVRTMSVLMLFS